MMNSKQDKYPRLIWDFGTGYELFSSLYIIHYPGHLGLRASWAAGVRSRLPADIREMFHQILCCFGLPLHWVYSLPEPKDARAVLAALEGMPPEDILPKLALDPDYPVTADQVFHEVMEKRSWNDKDLAVIFSYYRESNSQVKKKNLTVWLDWWTRPEECGKRFLQGLQDYFDGFFMEEEKRTRAYLEVGFNKARELAEKLSVPELLEEFVQGYKKDFLMRFEEIVMIPTFWAAPLAFYGKINEKQGVLQFDARPKEASLIPGELIPDSISRPLQALSDNTRLRILKLLMDEPLYQCEIAKNLRLRAPTITHHMKILRYANLITPVECENGEKRYIARMNSIDESWKIIKDFLKQTKKPSE